MPLRSVALTLSEMLRYCGEASSPFREIAWREFNQHYGKFIYSCVAKRCRAWNVARLKLQFHEIVDDIVGKVFYELCKEDGKALRGFKNVNDEKKFHGWLAVICHRVANRFLKQKWLEFREEESAEAVSREDESMDRDVRWELYDSAVLSMRNAAKRPSDLRERNINLFLLSTFGGFSEAAIRRLSCYKDMGERVVQVEVYRLRTTLREDPMFAR